jgi:hypothetical protein
MLNQIANGRSRRGKECRGVKAGAIYADEEAGGAVLGRYTQLHHLVFLGSFHFRTLITCWSRIVTATNKVN